MMSMIIPIHFGNNHTLERVSKFPDCRPAPQLSDDSSWVPTDIHNAS